MFHAGPRSRSLSRRAFRPVNGFSLVQFPPLMSAAASAEPIRSRSCFVLVATKRARASSAQRRENSGSPFSSSMTSQPAPPGYCRVAHTTAPVRPRPQPPDFLTGFRQTCCLPLRIPAMKQIDRLGTGSPPVVARLVGDLTEIWAATGLRYGAWPEWYHWLRA